ncbi:MAG: TetR family transcriptional regulator, partial [Rhodococcus sp. (in: high G+C Gram-positive bacteria)]|nr:TetR family transcriptional regulator [Rhodococcus sp. (in: high G+C Gram-positive bacteria)]
MSAAKAATVGTGNGRQAILDSALRNMNERGYHGTSMRDIARDADITVASIYHHFKSKQEILQDIMTRALHDAIAMTRGALLRAGGLPDAQLQA